VHDVVLLAGAVGLMLMLVLAPGLVICVPTGRHVR
jgi:hypothetical protein